MPYNTRRKSLSLPSLGIALPSHSRAHRSNSKSSTPEVPVQPPTKRVKRSHDEEPLSPVSPPPPARKRVTEQTPPPSPGNHCQRRVDTEGINDDIVVAVIEQLEKTGNRPHLIKELATVLANANDSIAHSANPAALLSSRLSLYLKRPWTVLSPCPLAKELMDVHPRKVFFYLTTMPRQPLPENSDDIIISDIKRLTPSISDPSVEEEEADRQERNMMSPSPEIELFSPELDTNAAPPPPPTGCFVPKRNSEGDGTSSAHRAPSPPLEADERGFTETATALRKNKTLQSVNEFEVSESKNDDGYELFGNNHSLVVEHKLSALGSSPMISARQPTPKVYLDVDMVDIGLSSWNLLSPECINVDELDEMFTDF